MSEALEARLAAMKVGDRIEFDVDGVLTMFEKVSERGDDDNWTVRLKRVAP